MMWKFLSKSKIYSKSKTQAEISKPQKEAPPEIYGKDPRLMVVIKYNSNNNSSQLIIFYHQIPSFSTRKRRKMETNL